MIKRILTGRIRLFACTVALQGTLGCCGLCKMFKTPVSLSSSSCLDVLPLAMLVAWGRRTHTHHLCLCCGVSWLCFISSITASSIYNAVIKLAAPAGKCHFIYDFFFLSGFQQYVQVNPMPRVAAPWEVVLGPWGSVILSASSQAGNRPVPCLKPKFDFTGASRRNDKMWGELRGQAETQHFTCVKCFYCVIICVIAASEKENKKILINHRSWRILDLLLGEGDVSSISRCWILSNGSDTWLHYPSQCVTECQLSFTNFLGLQSWQNMS